ncbi:MAG: hypothetical protein HXS48_14340 [Theionarchaea archaeon]|nr:hypothetical protein [Theionarchaea archaeon]
MRGMWLFCLCVLLLAQLLAQPAELLVIDDFETEGGWLPAEPGECTITVLLDRLNVRDGQASLRLEAELTDSYESGCFAGISREAPNLTGYAFLRLWVRPDQPSKALLGIHLGSDKGDYLYPVPLDNTRWNLITVSFEQFKSEEQSEPLAPEDVKTISFLMAAGGPATAKVNIDRFIALTDLNDNGVPDIDEAQMGEAAQNSEELADRYFNNGDYEKAEKYYQEAKSLYERMGNREKAQEMDSRAKESRAWFNYEKGEEFYENKEYTKAMEAYERARKDFVLVGNLDMVDTCENRLNELSELTGRPVSPVPERPPGTEQPTRPREGSGAGGLLFVLAVVFLVGVGVYFWKFRGGEPKAEDKKPVPPVEPSKTKAEEIRKLKAKFVYGEINRKEYEKKLRELEDKT